MLPKQKDIEIPLLEVLIEIGGQGQPKEIYPLVTKRFPGIGVEDLAQTLPSGGDRWTSRIQWVRQRLVQNGDMSGSTWGVWAITEKGRKRVQTGKTVPQMPSADFVELYEEYEANFRSRLLDRLNELSPREFEVFAGRLLQAYGFVKTEVAGRSPDGGVDGHGRLVLGLAEMNVAFQCKKWQGNVGRPDVDKFRGAIQGEYEQGVFFVTSDFTAEARDASLKKGAVPIVLVNGEGIIDLMINKEIGVERNPLYMYYDRDLPTGSLEEE
jgi:restriction system protein